MNSLVRIQVVTEFQKTISPAGDEIAYATYAGTGDCIVFLGGFMSDMTGSKASALHEMCEKHNRNFLRFDYRGHGASGGKFTELSISDWLDDALFMIDNFTTGAIVLVGSSMGGWLALLVAMRRPERVKALVGIAAAPDFTADLINEIMSDEQKAALHTDGKIELPAEFGNPYIISKRLIEGAYPHLIMSYEEWPIEVPVRLLHGMKDAQIKWTTALRISEKLSSKDVQVYFDKEGDHRFSAPQNIELLCSVVISL